MKKNLLLVVGVVVLGVVGVAIYGLKNLDSLVKQVIEQVGTEVTGTKVSVAGVKITLAEGRGEIHGLNIANPAGFNTRHLFHLNTVALDITPESLLGDVIVIDEVLIDGAEIVTEQKGQTTNLQALQKNLAKHSQGSTTQSEKASSADQAAGKPVRLAIKSFKFINNNAQLHTEQWEPQQLNVPNIVMTNLGSPTSGLTPEQLSAEVIDRLTKAVEKSAKEALKKKAEKEAKKALNKELDKNLSDKEKKQLDSLKSMF